jgi:two-component system response regulator VicR
MHLKKKGCVVFRANNGEDGLKLALSESPDLILLDILLPKIDGLQVLKKIREGAEAIKDVPVILLTNLNPDKEEINQTITQTYPAYYLVKSNWNVDDVIDKVRERLSRK